MRPLSLHVVLAAVDLDGAIDVALDAASQLARAAAAELHVIHVVAPDRAADANEPATYLERVLRERELPVRRASIHIAYGPVAETVCLTASRIGAEVIVVGLTRNGFGHALGGTARAIAEIAPVPSLVVARPLALPLRHVLVPIDRSDTARGALLVALSWASALRARAPLERPTKLTAIHMHAPGDETSGAMPSMVHELAAVRAQAGGWAGVVADGLTMPAPDTAEAIVDYARSHHVDLIVLGTRGVGLDRIQRLGSVSASVAAALPAPLLLVPPAVWRAVVEEGDGG